MFISRRGGVLAIIGEPTKFGTILKYPVICSMCHEDFKLFPEEKYSTLGNLRKGHDPCGCAKNVQWTEYQNIIRIERKCNEKGYRFLKFKEKYHGANTKLILECKKDNNIWDTTTLSKFVNSNRGCPKCRNNNIGKANIKPTEDFIEKFNNTGVFVEGTTFTRNTSKVNSLGYNISWDVNCPICSTDEYVVHGLCSGVFTSTSSSLKSGGKPCRCNNTYSWTKEQREYQINKICEAEGFIFKGWLEDKVRYSYGDKFNWICSRNHHSVSIIDSFINQGTRCKSCSNANSVGKYIYRGCEVDYLYLFRFTNGEETFIKVGRSFNVKRRLQTLKATTPYTIEVLATKKGIHSNIYKEEQDWHDHLTDYHYTPRYTFGGSTLECFDVASLQEITIQ